MSDDEERTLAVYRAILEHVATEGYEPSIRQVCLRVGIASSSTVWEHVNKLAELGLIKRVGPQHRIKLGSLDD